MWIGLQDVDYFYFCNDFPEINSLQLSIYRNHLDDMTRVIRNQYKELNE